MAHQSKHLSWKEFFLDEEFDFLANPHAYILSKYKQAHLAIFLVRKKLQGVLRIDFPHKAARRPKYINCAKYRLQ
jgi:hypothetical protein